MLIAYYEGEFNIGNRIISAAVLPNGKRVITQATFLRSLGRSKSVKGGTGVLTSGDGLPFFLQAEVLKPFISEELIEATARSGLSICFFKKIKKNSNPPQNPIRIPLPELKNLG